MIFLRRKIFFFFFWELTQQLSCFKCGGSNFGPPFFLPFPFFFFAFSSLHLSSTIVTIHILLLLDFSSSPHHFLSKKITFLRFSTFLYSSPSIFFQILVFLAIFLHTHFCETHFHTPLFFAQKCHHLPMGPLFLLFIERNIIHHLNGMVRRSSFQTPRPMPHIPTWTSRWVFLCFFVWKNVISMLHWKFDVETLSFYCVLLLEFGALHGWPCCNLGFGNFWIVVFFLSWFNLNNVSESWILAMLVICDVVGWLLTWILGKLKLWEICRVGLDEYIYDACGKSYWHV